MSLQTISFAIKNAFRKKIISVLSIAGIAIGISLMVVLSAATAGMDQMMTDTLAETVGDVEAVEYNKAAPISQLPVNISSIIYTIDSHEKIEAVSPEIYTHGFDQYSAKYSLPSVIQLTARGVNKTNDAQFDGPTTALLEGRLYENPLEIIVADFVVDEAPEYFAVGSTIEFTINQTMSLDLYISGIFETEDGPVRFLYPVFLMSVETARTINDLYLPQKHQGYNVVRVRFDTTDVEETKEYKEELEQLTPKLTVKLLGEGANAAGEVMETFDIFSMIISIVSIIAGGMAIIVAQLMGVNERMKEFAIMKATGWKNRTIFFDIILESVIIGVIGSLVGLGLGTLLIFAVEKISERAFVTMTWQIIVTVIGFGLGLGLLGGLLPGYQAARVKPMEVIRGL
ncbi:MAG: FtsX-like permease family protein [Candidatus Heimdallarchaeota archaeon]|nr:FtsX-like permease family protein [Candidatus Heimdallarchaeota archaeon]